MFCFIANLPEYDVLVIQLGNRADILSAHQLPEDVDYGLNKVLLVELSVNPVPLI